MSDNVELTETDFLTYHKVHKELWRLGQLLVEVEGDLTLDRHDYYLDEVELVWSEEAGWGLDVEVVGWCYGEELREYRSIQLSKLLDPNYEANIKAEVETRLKREAEEAVRKEEERKKQELAFKRQQFEKLKKELGE